MGIVVGIVMAIAAAIVLIWAVKNPGPETTMGAENRARREAKKASKRADVEGRSGT